MSQTIKQIIRTVFSLALFIALLFVPAGRLDWWAAWIFIGAFFLSVSVLFLWLKRKDPALLKERRQGGENVKGWDKVIIRIYSVVLFVLLITAGLDAGRFGWAPVPTVLRILGGAALLAAMVIGWRTFLANTFLGGMVRIQRERGHTVVTTGPYRYVRHPMYVGVILSILGIPLVLNSFWALVPGGMIVILFVIRTALEDRTLIEELEGYKEYAERVRFRLLPYVW